MSLQIPIPNDPYQAIMQLGLPFFAGLLIGTVIAYAVTKRVYLSIVIGVAVGAIALIVVSDYAA